jgi:ABC-type lipoprotein release transport system permease subunit
VSYRRVLVTRWSRRDRLAVLVVAVTIAFLVGTALLVVAAGDQTAAIASEQGTPGIAERYDSLAAARQGAPSGAAVLPIATARTPAGANVTVVGRTDAGRRLDSAGAIDLFAAPNGTTSGTLEEPGTVSLDGTAGAETLRVESRGRTVLSPEWYVASPETVRSLGTTGALVVTPTEDSAPREGVPLRGALAFFVFGTMETIRVLSVAVLGAGLLVAVTIYSVTRMTVRDRLDAIRVARSTGAEPRGLLAVFGLRGALLAGVGVALGYAAGVILPSVAVNAAVFLGLPTSLAAAVTPGIARIVAVLAVATVALGALAGVVAAWPAVRRPVAALGGERGTRADEGSWLAPQLLAPATFVPTAATLTAFVLFATLVAGMGGAVAPLSATDGATVVEPGAVHPIASDVPEGYAAGLRARGIDASPEILGFAAADGRAFVVRGVNATAFAEVTDTRMTEGRHPEGRTEALVGADLARTRGIDVGDRVLVGGSTVPAVTEVDVVGIVAAPGVFDDQLLVSLPAARHLTGVGPDSVQFIRTGGVPEGAGGAENGTGESGGAGSVGVVDVAAPDRARANDSIEVGIRVANDGLGEATRTITISFDGTTRTRRVTLASGGSRTIPVTFPTGKPGTDTLGVAGRTRAIEVVSPDAIEIGGLPERAPPDSTLRVRVQRLTGEPVADATVAVGNRSAAVGNQTATTGADGVAAVRLGGAGEAVITARRGSENATATVPVVAGTPRDPLVDLRVEPSSPGVLTRPTARVELANPWNRTLSRTVRIEAGGGAVGRNVTLAPGGATSLSADLQRRPPGSYAVAVRIDGRRVAETTYAVTGDDRIAAAVAEGATPGQSGIGRSVQVAFGNLELVLGAIVVLAGLMTVGGTTVSFARAVQGRRRTIGIYRATGASPWRVLRIVLGDALRIGAAATVVALLAGVTVLWLFEAAGLLSPFGVGLSPVPAPGVALGIAAGALGVALLGAALATAGFLREPPVALLADDRGVRSRSGTRE